MLGSKGILTPMIPDCSVLRTLNRHSRHPLSAGGEREEKRRRFSWAAGTVWERRMAVCIFRCKHLLPFLHHRPQSGRSILRLEKPEYFPAALWIWSGAMRKSPIPALILSSTPLSRVTPVRWLPSEERIPSLYFGTPEENGCRITCRCCLKPLNKPVV